MSDSPFMYSQKWDYCALCSVQSSYFQNRIILFCLPIPTLILLYIYLCEIYIFQDRSVYFAATKYVDGSWEFYKSLTDTWMWNSGLRPRNNEYIKAIFVAGVGIFIQKFTMLKSPWSSANLCARFKAPTTNTILQNQILSSYVLWDVSNPWRIFAEYRRQQSLNCTPWVLYS